MRLLVEFAMQLRHLSCDTDSNRHVNDDYSFLMFAIEPMKIAILLSPTVHKMKLITELSKME